VTLFDRVWQLPNTYVDSGRLPRYVGVVRIGDRVEVQAFGRTAIERDHRMSADTLFRLASMSKPIGVARIGGTGNRCYGAIVSAAMRSPSRVNS